MPIEIKELHIKINIDEAREKRTSVANQSLNIKGIKAEIIRKCTRDVLEILSERQER